MSQTKSSIWTYDNYYNLQDDKRYEVMEGELVEMEPAPKFKHQLISMNLSFEIKKYLKNHPIGTIVASPIDVKLDDKNVYQPDLVYISNQNKKIISEKAIEGVPDLVMEILSPSDKDRDRVNKFNTYQNFGIPECWIIDPDQNSIEVFRLVENKYQLYSEGKNNSKISSSVLSDFSISFYDLIE